jgi:hypothetical protein
MGLFNDEEVDEAREKIIGMDIYSSKERSHIAEMCGWTNHLSKDNRKSES